MYWQAEQRFSWQSYLDQKGAIRALRSSSDEYLLECPDCGKVKLAVNAELRVWRCFVCGDAGRDAGSLIVKAEQMSWRHAMERVITGIQREIGPIDEIQTKVEEETVPRVLKPILWPDGCHSLASTNPASDRGAAYCYQRQIPDYVALEMRLAVCDKGRFKNRLIFPVFDSGGRLVFFQGRAMWQPRAYERHIKTLSPRQEVDDKNMPLTAGPADCLLNLQYLVDKGQCERVLVVEGPVDCAHGWPDCVATFGKRLSSRQIELLMRAGVREIDLCWDSDAMESMLKLAPKLADLFVVRIVALPAGTDPGDYNKEQLENFRRQSVVWDSGKGLDKISYELA